MSEFIFSDVSYDAARQKWLAVVVIGSQCCTSEFNTEEEAREFCKRLINSEIGFT